MPFNPITNIPEDVGSLPICVLDLGFAEDRTSVGLAWNIPEETSEINQFGAAISSVNSWLNARSAETQRRVVLLLEAPLSMAFTDNGNPCHRNLELQRNYAPGRAPRSPKGWWYQAGANLSLASIVFLRALEVPETVSVLLAEGFFCSISPDEQHPKDDEVARVLLTAIQEQAGLPLVVPKSEVNDGMVRVLPGLEGLITTVPGVLLRPELELL